MDAGLLTPSKYIKAIDFNGKDRMFTITGIKIEELIREDNTKERKGTVSFEGLDQAWVLNVTNVKSLVAMFGRETDNWIGKKVVLFPEPNDMSESGFAIRIRGSPDLAADVTFTLKLARKKPKRVTLKTFSKTNGGGRRPAPQQQTLSPVDDAEPPANTDSPDDASFAALDPK